MSVVSTRGLILPKFDPTSKVELWQWKMAMKAYATVCGCAAAFSSTPETDRPATEADGEMIDPSVGSADEKKEKKLHKAAFDRHNRMSALVQSSVLEAVPDLVAECRTAAYPNGDCSKLVQLLDEMFEPQDDMANVAQTDALMSVSMEANEDPLVLRQQLARAQAKNLKNKIDEKIKVSIVIKKSPKKYHPLVYQEIDKLQADGEEVTADKLLKAMHAVWRFDGGDHDAGNDEGNELQLSAFSGKCWNCDEVGHKSNDCPKRKNLSNIECYECGKRGHYARNCWEREENKDKRPDGWKSSKTEETGATAIELFL